jgi:hypothetical protein
MSHSIPAKAVNKLDLAAYTASRCCCICDLHDSLLIITISVLVVGLFSVVVIITLSSFAWLLFTLHLLHTNDYDVLRARARGG